MTSRDFGFLTLRNTIAYQPNGDPVPANYVFITSSSGAAIFSDNVTIDILNASTINTSTINTDTLNASTINAYTINADIFNVSTLNASTIVIDTITTSTINVITLNTSSIITSSIITNYLTVNSTATISTLNATNINASTLNLLTLNTSSIFTSSILTSSLLTSSIITNYLTVNSTATVSTLNTLNLTISSSGGININSPYDTIIGGPAQNIQLNASNINITSGDLNINGTAISRVSISTITGNPGTSGSQWLNLYGKYCFVSSGIQSVITLPSSELPSAGTIIIIRNTGTGVDPPITASPTVANTGNSTFVGKTSSYVYVTGVANNIPGWYAL